LHAMTDAAAMRHMRKSLSAEENVVLTDALEKVCVHNTWHANKPPSSSLPFTPLFSPSLPCSCIQLQQHEHELVTWANRKHAEQEASKPGTIIKKRRASSFSSRSRGRKSSISSSSSSGGGGGGISRSQSSSNLKGRRSRFVRAPRVLFASCGGRNVKSPPSAKLGPGSLTGAKENSTSTIGNSDNNHLVNDKRGDKGNAKESEKTRTFGTEITDGVNSTANKSGSEKEQPQQILSSDPFPIKKSEAGSKTHGQIDPAGTSKATAVLQVTIRLNVDSFDDFKLEAFKLQMAKVAGVPPSQIGLKLARGRVLRRASTRARAKPTQTDNKTGEGDVFFDVGC